MSDGKKNTGYGNTGYWNTGNVNTGDWNTGYGNTGYWNTGNVNTGDWNTGNRNTGYRNTGNRNTGNRNTGNRNTGNVNTGNRNTGNVNTGDWNTGYGNTTDRESGIFCTTESNTRLFNKPTNLKWDEIDHPHFSEFYLTKWIPENKMTDQEKVDNKTFHTTGGYLREYTYKDAWLNFWNDTDQENKNKFLNLPNFDADIFEEITGINVNQKSNEYTIEQLEELTGIKNLKIKK